MSLDPTEELSKATGRFPFAMAITAIFFSGSVFVLFNGPLLIQMLNGKFFSNSTELINNGIFSPWLAVMQTSSSIFSISVFLLLSFITGIVLTPIERLNVAIISLPLNLLASVFSRLRRYKPFTPSEMVAEDYEHILGWLLTKPSEKSHWEWELFNYYVYWSIATNSVIFSLLSPFLLKTLVFSLESIIYFLLCGIFIGFALLHSCMMYRVHQRYRTLSNSVPASPSKTILQSAAPDQKNITEPRTGQRARTKQPKSP